MDGFERVAQFFQSKKDSVVEFGKHISKGLWAFADKALPVVYGLCYVLLVIRQLPKEEFGNFVLVQEIFLIGFGLATAFSFYPLLKYAAEESDPRGQVTSAALLLNIGFLLLFSGLAVVLREPLSGLLNSDKLAPLLMYMPVLLSVSCLRSFALILLQARFQVKHVFWVDAAHFLGAPVLMLLFTRLDMLHSAFDVILINILSISTSSLVGLFLSRPLISLTLRPGREGFKKIWSYGKYSLGSNTSYLFYSKADSFILSAFSSPIQVAVYNSVKVFVRIYDMMAQIIQMFVLPAASRLSSRGEFVSLKTVVEKAIMFSTVALLPCFVFFLVLSPILVQIYGEKYETALPLLQIFSALCFVVPLIAVAGNVLMGLAQTETVFTLNLKVLLGSIVIYLILIPWLGAVGAAIGYVVASFLFAWLSAREMKRFVPVTIPEILLRAKDIQMFLISRLRLP